MYGKEIDLNRCTTNTGSSPVLTAQKTSGRSFLTPDGMGFTCPIGSGGGIGCPQLGTHRGRGL